MGCEFCGTGCFNCDPQGTWEAWEQSCAQSAVGHFREHIQCEGARRLGKYTVSQLVRAGAGQFEQGFARDAARGLEVQP